MIVKNGPVGDYFYKNGVVEKCYQLIEYKGDFYFIDAGNKLLKNTRVYLSQKFIKNVVFEDGSILEPGYYSFDANGKMILN